MERDQTVERDVTIERSSPSWVGDMNEVERAVVLFESLVKERAKRLKAAKDGSEDHDSVTAGATSKRTQVASTSGPDVQAERRLFPTEDNRRAFMTEFPEVAAALIRMQDNNRRIADAYRPREADDQVVATVAYPEEVVRGDYATLAKELDRRRYMRLRIELDDDKSFESDFYLEWKAKAEAFYDRREIGVNLHIRSKDRGWAMQALAQLTDEIDRGRPKWEWIYGWKGRALLVLSVITTALVVVYSLGVRCDYH